MNPMMFCLLFHTNFGILFRWLDDFKALPLWSTLAVGIERLSLAMKLF